MKQSNQIMQNILETLINADDPNRPSLTDITIAEAEALSASLVGAPTSLDTVA